VKHLETYSMSESTTKRPTMAETLRTAITESGETVAAVSRGAGIAQPVLHRFATGKRDFTLRTADRLLQYFDLELRPRARHCDGAQGAALPTSELAGANGGK
jgi:hypothetical protein